MGADNWPGRFAEARERIWALEAELERIRIAYNELKGNRIISAVFGHHKGAPRPFALRGEAGITLALGAEWPNGAVALQWIVPGLEGGWHTRQSGGVDEINTNQRLLDGGEFEVIWLSDELPALAEMERERDEAQAGLRAAAENVIARRAELDAVEAERDQAFAAGRAAAAAAIRDLSQPPPKVFPVELSHSPYWSSLSGPYGDGWIEWCARVAEGKSDD